jgi:TPR repeat protein
MFENGEGTEKNFEKSQEYYKIALERGFQAAQEKISEQKPEENIDS